MTIAAIPKIKQTGEAVVLRVNGNAESYQKLLDALEKLEAIVGIKQGLEDVEAGRTVSMEDFELEMQQNNDISS